MPGHPDAERRRILVVANETVTGEALLREIEREADGDGEVLVLSPAIAPRRRLWVSDIDGAVEQATERLERSVAELRERGIEARGEVGDCDPLLAIEDALRTFEADELILSTHPQGRSNWLEKRVVPRAEERFDLPLTHVVVDLEAERAEVPAGARGDVA
jgi:GABA permease